jgi:hypothetical protein
MKAIIAIASGPKRNPRDVGATRALGFPGSDFGMRIMATIAKSIRRTYFVQGRSVASFGFRAFSSKPLPPAPVKRLPLVVITPSRMTRTRHGARAAILALARDDFPMHFGNIWRKTGVNDGEASASRA